MSHPARSALEPPGYDGHFVMIPLTKGKFAIVDEADAQLVLSYGKWSARGPCSGENWYAFKYLGGPPLGMHTLITGYKETDHANRNGLDNRRINLRDATRSQNQANRGPLSSNKSGYKGVSWSRAGGKWTAGICVNGKSRNLGMFTDPVDAARAYNAAALEAWGEFAWLNPLSPRSETPPSAAVDEVSMVLVARVFMEFPRARHLGRYITWRAGIEADNSRRVLWYLLDKGWVDEETAPGPGHRSSRYYRITEAGKEGFTALLAAA